MAGRRAPLIVLTLLVSVGLAACGSSSPSSAPPASSAAASPSGAAASCGTDAAAQVEATGEFGAKPTLTVPACPAPSALASKVLSAGKGEAVASGQTIVVNYLGQTWAPKDGEPNIFDNSYDREQPVGFPIGVGAVIKGWDEALVGQKLGSRVLVTIPPALAYGPQPSHELKDQTLIFVVDMIDAIDKNAAAKGTEVRPTTKGLPAVTSKSGEKPSVTSVDGVSDKGEPVSALLIKGTGDKIDKDKSLALQIVQTDAATGKQTQETWGSGLQVVPAQNILPVIAALDGARIGSRAVAAVPAQGDQAAAVFVIDVVGQY